jgi:hypothetical protein
LFLFFAMLYLITGEWIEDPTVSLQEYATLWDQMIRPSLEALSNMADEKKTGGVFAGQREGVLILDVSSHEEVGRFLASLPFWSRLKWNVTPLQSYRSTIERDSKALGGKG